MPGIAIGRISPLFEAPLHRYHEEGPLIFDARAWEQLLGVTSLQGGEAAPPSFDWRAIDPYFEEPYQENYALVYMPPEISLEQITEINFPASIQYMSSRILTERGSDHQEGWFLISTKAFQTSFYKTHQEQKQFLATHQFRMPTLLEALVISLLHKQEMETTNLLRCVEKLEEGGDCIYLTFHEGRVLVYHGDDGEEIDRGTLIVKDLTCIPAGR